MVTAFASSIRRSRFGKGAEGVIRQALPERAILNLVAKGIRKRKKEEERQSLRQAMTRSVSRDAIVGRSDKMEDIFRLVERVAPARSTVLITGESGTGKELVAKAIHEASPRADKPFVVVNCSNIPSELLESELFGHTKGAFTGAVAAKKFLRSLIRARSFWTRSATSGETQVRLLRVIQEREFTPIGETSQVKVVWIIAATLMKKRSRTVHSAGPLLSAFGRRSSCRRSASGRGHSPADAAFHPQIQRRERAGDFRTAFGRGALAA